METEKRTWQETLKLLQYEYTLSIRDVCKMLKASRSWINRYIKPHVRSIYLNSNTRAGVNVPMKRNWVRLAALELDRPDMTESVWLHKNDVLELLKKSVISITKQTKYVPVARVMSPDVAALYVSAYNDIKEKIKESKSPTERIELMAELDSLHLSYLDDRTRELIKHSCSIVKRGDVERIDVAYPGEFDPTVWVAAHDIKEYGDTDEDIYRHFFRTGHIRIELSVPDENGEIGNKVYYIPDPEPLPPAIGKVFILPEIEWLKYRAH